jgi:hypothetical protein
MSKLPYKFFHIGSIGDDGTLSVKSSLEMMKSVLDAIVGSTREKFGNQSPLCAFQRKQVKQDCIFLWRPLGDLETRSEMVEVSFPALFARPAWDGLGNHRPLALKVIRLDRPTEHSILLIYIITKQSEKKEKLWETIFRQQTQCTHTKKLTSTVHNFAWHVFSVSVLLGDARPREYELGVTF